MCKHCLSILFGILGNKTIDIHGLTSAALRDGRQSPEELPFSISDDNLKLKIINYIM